MSTRDKPLTEDDRAIYEWQLSVSGFGEEGQRRLKNAGVLISRVGGVGAGLLIRSYQQISGRRVPVASRFSLRGDKTSAYGFMAADYDARQPLVIDPGVVYSTFLGGASFNEEGQAIAVDGAGSAYVTGFTSSADFPTTAGAFDVSYGSNSDPFAECIQS